MTWLMFRNVILAGFCSGIMFWGMKFGARAFKAEAMLTVMFLASSAAYIPFMMAKGTLPDFKAASSVAIGGLVVATAACAMTNLLGFTQYVKPGVPSAVPFSVAMGVNIAIQAAGAVLLFGEGISLRHAAGIVCMIAAMALLKP